MVLPEMKWSDPFDQAMWDLRRSISVNEERQRQRKLQAEKEIREAGEWETFERFRRAL